MQALGQAIGLTVRLLVVLYVWLLCLAAWDGGPAMFGPSLLSVLVIAFTAIFVHELGHAVAAVACGHRVIVFAARPFAWHVHNRQFIFMARGYEAGLGGLVFSTPRDRAVVTLSRRRWIVAGGPIASALLAVIALAAGAPSLTAYTSAAMPSMHVGLLVFGLGTWSALLTITSFLPYGTQSHRSDGEQLWAMRHGLNKERYLLGVLAGHSKYAVRLRDWPEWLLKEVAARPPAVENFDAAIDQWEIGRVLDAETVDPSEARSRLDAFREKYGNSEWLASCDAYFTAVWEGDAALAAARLWRSEPTNADHALSAAAEAAVAACAGDAVATAGHLAVMRREIAKRSPFLDLTFRDIEKQIQTTLATGMGVFPTPAA